MFINEWRKIFYQYRILWVAVLILSIGLNIFFASLVCEGMQREGIHIAQQVILEFESFLLRDVEFYFWSSLLPFSVMVYFLLSAVGEMEQLRYQGRVFLVVFRLVTLAGLSALLAFISQVIYFALLGVMSCFLTKVSILYLFMVWHGTFTIGLLMYFVYELLDRRHLLPIVFTTIGGFFLLVKNVYSMLIRENLFYLIYSEKALAFSSTFFKELVAKGGLNAVCIIGVFLMSGTGGEVIKTLLSYFRRFSYRRFLTPPIYKLGLIICTLLLFIRYRDPELSLSMLFYPDLSRSNLGIWDVVMDNVFVVWLYALCILLAHDYFLRQLLEPDIFEAIRMGKRRNFIQRFLLQTFLYAVLYAVVTLPAFVCMNGSAHSGQWQIVMTALPFLVISLWSLLLIGGALGLYHPALGVCGPVIVVMLSLFAKKGYSVLVLQPEWHMQGLCFHLLYAVMAIMCLNVFYAQKDMR